MDTKYMDNEMYEIDNLDRLDIETLKSLSTTHIFLIISKHINPNVRLRHLYYHQDTFYNKENIVIWEVNENCYTSKGKTFKEIIEDIQTTYEELVYTPSIPIAQIMESIVGQLKETNFTIKNIEDLKSYFHGINHMNNLIIKKFEEELGKSE